MSSINDILNAATVNTAISLAKVYALTEHGVFGQDNQMQFVRENFPDLVLQKELVDQGILDIFGNRIDDPNYSRIESQQNPTIAEVPADLQGGYTTPVSVSTETELPVTDQGILSEPTPFTGTIQDTLFDSSRDYAESDFGQSVNAVPYTEDFVPTTLTNVTSDVNAGPEEPTGGTGGIFGSFTFKDLVKPFFESGVIDTSGRNFMPTNLTGQFYGINPTTNNVELMQNMTQNPMFRSGVAGFTNTLPTGFEFGVPFRFGNLPQFQPQTFDEFVAEKEAEKEAEKNSSTGFENPGSPNFDQSKIGGGTHGPYK